MKKKIILLLILATLVAGGVFADAWNNSFKFNSGPTPQKGALFVNFGPTINYLILGGFGIGLGWESQIGSFSSILIDAEVGFYEYKPYSSYYYRYNEFDFAVEANYRYYFFKSAIDKLFINAGLGFVMLTRKYPNNSTYFREGDTGIWTALTIPVYAGYKVIIGPGFVLELNAGYRIGIGLTTPRGYSYNSREYGSGIYGIRIGWAF
jgi:hypothetical protein